MFVCQNDRKYNQIFETELNLNDLEKLTTKDEIRMDDQDEHAIDQVREVVVVAAAEITCEGIFKS